MFAECNVESGDAVDCLVEATGQRRDRSLDVDSVLRCGFGLGFLTQLVESGLDGVEPLRERSCRIAHLVAPRIVRWRRGVREELLVERVLRVAFRLGALIALSLVGGRSRRRDVRPLDGKRARKLEPGDCARLDQDLAQREAGLLLTPGRAVEILLGDVAVLEQNLADRALRRDRRGCRRALHAEPPPGDGETSARGGAPRGDADAASMLGGGIGTPLVRVIHPSKGHGPLARTAPRGAGGYPRAAAPID